MFELEKMQVKCTSASTNSENMGKSDNTRLGMSMYFEFQGSNELLNMFDTRLRTAMYERAADDQQDDITGHLPALKFKGIKEPLKWPYIGSGYKGVVHAELEFSETLEMEDCKLDNFTLMFRDDAVVGYKLRAYFHPKLEEVGKFAAMEKHEVTLSLTPPKASESSASQPAEESPQGDMLNDAPLPQDEVEILYPRAVAAVRATGNPTTSALKAELGIEFNQAAVMLSRMADEGVIAKGDDGEYHIVEAEDAA